MFNRIYKKSTQVAVATSNEYPAVVQEIHTSFMSAGEKLLKEAKEIIASAEVKDEEKVNRLKKIGFTNAGQVKAAEKAIEKKKQAERDAAIVEMYAIRYPQYKFITEDIVTQICEKYKLVMGGIQKYKGFVPEKNLLEIESFVVKDEDCIELPTYQSYGFVDEYMRQMSAVGAQSPFGLLSGQRRRRSMEEEYMNMQQAALYYARPEISQSPEPKNNKKEYKREFLICAPQKDMKIESYERVEGHKIVHVPDPVVLHPVKNGYLIVTAWGDEASDELVVNQTHN